MCTVKGSALLVHWSKTVNALKGALTIIVRSKQFNVYCALVQTCHKCSNSLHWPLLSEQVKLKNVVAVECSVELGWS